MMNTGMHKIRAKEKLILPLDESGAIAVVVSLTFIVLCGFAALAFDLGHIVMVKGELQRTADAAALAGVTGFMPYTNPGPNQTPNWLQGQQKAHAIINNVANMADNQQFSITEGTVLYGYWLLNPPANYVQLPLPTVRPAISNLPEPAINVTISRNVTLYLAPLIGVSSPKTVSATSTAILPEAYQDTNMPPIAVSEDTVYNKIGQNMIIDVAEQDIKPQTNKEIAGWFNLDGSNNVPSCRINTPLTSSTGQIYTVPGTKATLTDFITPGETVVVPVVQLVESKCWENIIGFAAFKVDSVGANDMQGHFVDQYFDPNVKPAAGTGIIGGVAGRPKLVGP